MTAQEMAEEVATLLGRRLRVGGRDLEAKLRRGGRALPRKIRQEAAFLARAAAQSRNPTLALRQDQARLKRAHATCIAYLGPLGRGARARIAVLDFAARLALILLVVTAVMTAGVWWSGHHP